MKIRTGNAFVNTAPPWRRIWKRQAPPHVCYVNRIPFLAVRSITDTSGDIGAEAFDRNCERASEIAAEVTSGLLRSWI